MSNNENTMLSAIYSGRSVEPQIRSADPKAPSTFERFSTLPMEIQLQIWADALPPSRLHRLKATRTSPDSAEYTFEMENKKYKVDIILLRVCRESRQVVLEQYPVLPSKNGKGKIRVGPKDFFHFDKLHLLVSDLIKVQSLGITIPTYFSKIENLALYSQNPGYRWPRSGPEVAFVSLGEITYDRLEAFMKVFPNLQIIHLICDARICMKNNGDLAGFRYGQGMWDWRVDKFHRLLGSRAWRARSVFEERCQSWNSRHDNIIQFPKVLIMSRKPKGGWREYASLSWSRLFGRPGL